MVLRRVINIELLLYQWAHHHFGNNTGDRYETDLLEISSIFADLFSRFPIRRFSSSVAMAMSRLPIVNYTCIPDILSNRKHTTRQLAPYFFVMSTPPYFISYRCHEAVELRTEAPSNDN